jgi:hypothetical protein
VEVTNASRSALVAPDVIVTDSIFLGGYFKAQGGGIIHGCYIKAGDSMAMDVSSGGTSDLVVMGCYLLAGGTSSGAYALRVHNAFTQIGRLLHCYLKAGTNAHGVRLMHAGGGNYPTNMHFDGCTILKGSGGTWTVDADNTAATVAVMRCSLNAALNGNITNSIGVPYNVVDADVE